MSGLKKTLAVLVCFCVIVLGYFIAWNGVRNYVRSAALILEIFPLTEFKPLSFAAKEPKKIEVNIPSRGQELNTDIWLPGNFKEGKKYPVIILSPGVNLPKDDERIAAIINGMVRSGFVVSVSNMPELINSRYVGESVEDFINVYLYLENQPFAKQDKIGFVGFCLGSSLALLASSDQRIDEKVSFISVNDVLYDMYTFTIDAVTEKIHGTDPVITWAPLDEVRQILFTEYTDYIKDRSEAKTVYDSLVERKPLTEKVFNSLSYDAKVIYRFLSAKDSKVMAELFNELPAEGREIITAMSPKSQISKVKTKIFITSGRNVFLPAKQAIDLANDLPNDQVEYTSLNFFQHDKIVKSLSDWENIQQAILAIKHLKSFFDFVG